jgi:phospholipid/cholesterol/gamma-HCH transport system substrate-binding protein
VRPPSQSYDREILAGLFVILGIFVIGLFSMKITDSPIFRPGTELSVYLPDASGIFRNSKVKIAGINVGVVKQITLEEGQAKLTLLVDSGYKIEKGSYIVPRSQGILGDRYIEVVLPKNQEEATKYQTDGALPIPDSPTEGSSSSYINWKNILNGILPMASAAEVYQEGEVIPAKPGGATADEVMKKLGEVGEDVKVLARELKEMVKENRTDVRAAIKGIRSSADHLDLILQDLSEKNTRQDLKESIKGLRESVDNIKNISDRINKGEGSIGKLINDPQAADQLVRALNSIVEFLDRARRTEIIVDLNTNYLTGYKKTKTYFDIKVMPRSSYGYMFGIVQDEGGKETKTKTITVVDGTKPVITEERKFERSAFKLNLQFLRKIYATTLRLGLFESAGGFGIDQELWRDHLFLTAEAFDFGRDDENAHVRVFAKLQFLDTFYIQGGCDEMAAKSGKTMRKALFAGVGLQFNDNDLKNFLMFFGFP